jgi:hypothetical protein
MSHAIMSRAILPALLLLGLLPLPAPGHAAEPMTFKSESIQLPFGSSDFPPGPGVDAVKKNCLLCHSPRMILYQPTLTKEGWTKEVDKMINVFKAPVVKEDIPAILDYLTHFQAAKE